VAEKFFRIGITTGDSDGIGLEVTLKALRKIGPIPGVQFVVWKSSASQKSETKKLEGKFNVLRVHSWPEALNQLPRTAKDLVEIRTPTSEASWVEQCAKACWFRHLDAMVTAPLSKTAIKKSGMSDLGHTDILKRVTSAKAVYMGFLGREFSLVLATGHIPLSAVASSLTTPVLFGALQAAEELRALVSKAKGRLPIGLVGLNPHAGEEGLIGKEEQSLYCDVLEQAKSAKMHVEGPLVPDAAFLKAKYLQHSVLVSPYHDQGLIPFKSIHGHGEGVHLTLGLPFVRTSVDHGTAKDIFGLDKADPGSMRDSILTAVKLVKKRWSSASRPE
jgi:4-hydroxythreonine-4-phosphate dehydrogenase